MRYVIGRTPWRKIRAMRDPSADVVVWLHHRYPDSWFRFLSKGDSFVKDAALLAAVAETGTRFRIVSGPAIGEVANATILYSIDEYNPARARNYSASLMAALRQLEAQGNTLYPSADEAEYWENKVFMHRRFDELGIRSPATTAIDRDTELAEDDLAYPLLVKEPHSANSEGLHKVQSADELRALRARLGARGDHELLIQEILDMRRDLRCTVIGGEIVHHYFRINNSDEWMPTTTRKGSSVDFVTFPEQWRAEIVEATRKLGLRNGAFDICWVGDDLDSPPYYLEVSPAYTPNPAPPASWDDRPYADFKDQLTGPDAFHVAFADLVFDMHHTMLEAWEFPS